MLFAPFGPPVHCPLPEQLLEASVLVTLLLEQGLMFRFEVGEGFKLRRQCDGVHVQMSRSTRRLNP